MVNLPYPKVSQIGLLEVMESIIVVPLLDVLQVNANEDDLSLGMGEKTSGFSTHSCLW